MVVSTHSDSTPGLTERLSTLSSHPIPESSPNSEPPSKKSSEATLLLTSAAVSSAKKLELLQNELLQSYKETQCLHTNQQILSEENAGLRKEIASLHESYTFKVENSDSKSLKKLQEKLKSLEKTNSALRTHHERLEESKCPPEKAQW